ncbi:MAG: hypothetical protein PHH60_03665, partial [Candidatus Margulisbacteria bacterium]|nr:hypothetical protein [Candidatus Margulisiibacteriota bacterium]
MGVQFSAEFTPYRKSRLFHSVYQNNPRTGTIRNGHSPDQRPLVIGDKGDVAGLKESFPRHDLLVYHARKPVYIFEQLGLAAYAAIESRDFRHTQRGAVLFHFSTHPDMEPTDSLPRVQSWGDIYQAFSGHYAEACFIWFLAERGLINEVFWFSSNTLSPAQPNHEIYTRLPNLKIHQLPTNRAAAFNRQLITDVPYRRRIVTFDPEYLSGVE